MSYIEKFTDVDLLELAQVKAYKRKIAGKLTDVKSAQRGGPGGGGDSASGKSGKQDKVSADQILAARVPALLTEYQKLLIQDRSTAYRDIVDKHQADHPVTSKEVKLAREVLLAMSDYYDSLVNPTLDYMQREGLRLQMQSKRLALRNAIRDKIAGSTKRKSWASPETGAQEEATAPPEE